MNKISDKELIKCIGETLVIDVRGEDFKGGNIINAINIPYEKFNINNFEKIYIENKKKYIIIHCMYSSMRGPGIYKLITKFLENKNIDINNIFILKDGFFNFINFAIKNNLLHIIDNYDKKYWILKNNKYTHLSEIFTNQ